MKPARHALRVGAAVAAGAALLAAASAAFVALHTRAAGAALYEGRQPLVARLVGHDQPLPPTAARCINCHEGPQAVGPALNERTLARTLARRGGPPSQYDAGSLCRLLREGTDPALVLVPRAMPRYEIDHRDCQALWAHLITR